MRERKSARACPLPPSPLRLILAALFALVASPVFLQAQAETIVIGKEGGAGTSARPAVTFTHQAHMAKEGLDCLSCHHRYEGKGGKRENTLDLGSLAEGESGIACSSCHAGTAVLTRAFHRLCIGCHDATASLKGAAAGPRICGECHPRAK